MLLNLIRDGFGHTKCHRLKYFHNFLANKISLKLISVTLNISSK